MKKTFLTLTSLLFFTGCLSGSGGRVMSGGYGGDGGDGSTVDNQECINNVCAPTFSPVPGYIDSTQVISLTTASSGATIYYNYMEYAGDAPNCSGNGFRYTGAFTVPASQISDDRNVITIEAIACSGGVASSITTAVYNFGSQPVTAPTFSPVPGHIASTQVISLTTVSPGATIYYRYMEYGGDPDCSGNDSKYTGAFTVPASQISDDRSVVTIKAVACSGGTASSVVTAVYNF